MLYKKPDNIRYVDMAIYIDDNIYRTDLTLEEENNIYIYIWHLYYMLAKKHQLFKRERQYDDFAVYAMSRLYKRYKFPKRAKPIKSVLNYIKQTLGFVLIDFQQEDFAQVLSEQSDVIDSDFGYKFSNQLSNSIDALSVIEFESTLQDVPRTVRCYLKRIPYSGITWHNIYLSCLLTLLNSITLTTEQIKKINNISTPVLRDNRLETYYKLESDKVLLYHLDESMENYIKVLVRQIKHIIAKDLSLELHTYIPASTGFHQAMVEDIGCSAILSNDEFLESHK